MSLPSRPSWVQDVAEALPRQQAAAWNTLLNDTVDSVAPTRVCLLGSFNSGKSSLLNRVVFGQKDGLLPVAQRELTVLPTFIGRGEVLKCYLTDTRGDEHLVDEATFRTAVVDRGREWQTARLEAPNPSLEGVLVVDLPGLGGNVAFAQTYVEAQLLASDAVIYLLEPRGPSAHDIAVLKRVAARGKACTVCAAKWDEVEGAPATEVRPTPAIWTRVLADHGLPFEVFPVSASTGFGVEIVATFLARCSREAATVRQRRFTAEAAELLQQADEGLRAQLEVMAAQSDAECEALAAKLVEHESVILEAEKALDTQANHDWSRIDKAGTSVVKDALACLDTRLATTREALLASPNEQTWAVFSRAGQEEVNAALDDLSAKLAVLTSRPGGVVLDGARPHATAIPYPTPPVIERGSLLAAAHLDAGRRELAQRLEELASAPATSGDMLGTDVAELRSQLTIYLAQERSENEVELPNIMEQVGGPGLATTIGRVLGEAADVGLMFVQPQLVGAKVASWLGKGARAVRVAKTVSTAAKVIQKIRKGAQAIDDTVKRQAPDLQGLELLEMVSVSYWAERLGGLIDGPPLIIPRVDPEALLRREARLTEIDKQKQELLARIHVEETALREKNISEYQRSERQREVTDLQRHIAELENDVAEAERTLTNDTQARHRGRVRSDSENAIRRWKATVKECGQSSLHILRAEWRAYWHEQVQQTLTNERARLGELRTTLQCAPEVRRAGLADVTKRLGVVREATQALRAG